VDVKPAQGFEHLGLAEVWLRTVDEAVWAEVCAAADRSGATGLEVWTTDETPEVAAFLRARGYGVVRSYAISELELASAPDPAPPAFPLTTLAERPDLERALYEVALVAYPDQPGRSDSRLSTFEAWRGWSLVPHPPDACFIALEDGAVLGYGYLTVEGDTATHGFTALARAARGRGIAGSIKRAQIAWARQHGIRTLRTANELRLTQMLSLNERLGYRVLYTELVFRGRDAIPPTGFEPVLPA
jgi:GNAT superfamily N-acetyltransferase